MLKSLRCNRYGQQSCGVCTYQRQSGPDESVLQPAIAHIHGAVAVLGTLDLLKIASINAGDLRATCGPSFVMTSKQSYRSRDPRLQRSNSCSQNAQLAGLPGVLEPNLPVYPAHHPFAKDYASIVLQPANDQMHRPRSADCAYAVGHHQHPSVQSVWYSWQQSQAAAASADYMCAPAVREGYATSSTGDSNGVPISPWCALIKYYPLHG